MPEVDRHRTALRRSNLSRPVRLALSDGVLSPGMSFFDYGCGHGGDVLRLRRKGFEAAGWDPVHRPGEKRLSDAVNLGYVVNVIESPEERTATLREAWSLAGSLLVVAARLEGEGRDLSGAPFSDGVVTRLGTFQKFFSQDELRGWIDSALGEESVPAAPGVFYVFRERAARETFAASRFHTRIASARLRRSDQLYAEHQELLDALGAFVEERGRLPVAGEQQCIPDLEAAFGSIRRAFAVIRRVTGSDRWDEVRRVRSSDLTVYLGLARFGGRPRFSELPEALQRDVRALFSSYRSACAASDELLFEAGDVEAIDMACRKSPVGKLTGNALYVHESALADLPPLLRVYEGCGRSYLGAVEGANIVKLHRGKPKISYLAYPSFDDDPHPALAASTSVALDSFRVRVRDYRNSESPPILHRKEELVALGYPLRAKFQRLTHQEERFGLYDDTSRIGLKLPWDALLTARGLRLQGHRVVRVPSPREP